MNAWSALLDVVRAAVFGLSHVYGGSTGFAILTLSLTARLALIPLRSKRAPRFAALATVPVAAALYTVIRETAGHGARFLWIRSLARPDALLGAIAVMVSAAMALTSPPIQTPALQSLQRVALMLPVLITLVIAAKMSSGIGLYWIASNAVTAGENFVRKRRRDERETAQLRG